MIDLEPYKGELVLLLLNRPVPYIGKDANSFAPLMLKTGDANNPQMPAMTDMLQGRLDKRGDSWAVTYINPFNKGARMTVAVDPRIVDAIYAYNEITIVTPAEMGLPGSG